MGLRPEKYLAEALGTFGLVFCGTGAIIVQEAYGGALGHVGVSLVFGLVVLAMIYSVGHISGAHLNPAVTAGFFAAGRLKAREVPIYWLAQIGGATAASLALRLIFAGVSTTWGATRPAGPAGQAFALELIFTFILMFVIMGVAHDNRAEGMMAGVAIGAAVALLALLGGPVTGASMNPARSFGPALIGAAWHAHWVYWAAPLLGAPLAARVYLIVQCHGSGPHDGSGGCC